MARNFGTPAKDDYGRLELESSTSSCVMEAPTLNETLCRALIHARLTEEDVAARLRVDPKTVRRWLEGRVPYLRYRWAIATMLSVGETDLWPQLRTTRTRPDEVIAIYPHRDTVPLDVWLRIVPFRAARDRNTRRHRAPSLQPTSRSLLPLLSRPEPESRSEFACMSRTSQSLGKATGHGELEMRRQVCVKR